MEEKKSFSQRVEHFLAGKGFYIVLFVCVAIIGASAWILFFSDAAIVDDDEDYVSTMADTGDTPVITYEPDTDDQNPGNKTNVKDDADKDTVTDTAGEKPEKTGDKAPVEQNRTDGNAASGESTPEAPDENEEDNKTAAYIWPVSGNIAVGYSGDTLVFSKTMNDWRTHGGVDIEAAMGAKVMAVSAGQVEEVYEDDMYGTTVVIDHGSGLKSIYCNLAGTPTVKEGDSVTMGSVIGSVGDTALGEIGEVAHLHFEMTRDGKNIDPTEVLPKK